MEYDWYHDISSVEQTSVDPRYNIHDYLKDIEGYEGEVDQSDDDAS